MSIDPNRAKSIFLSAVEDLSPTTWHAYLDEVCRGDTELRQRVEALLAAHQGTDKLLDDPGAVLIGPSGPVELTEVPGTVIGRYKLLERIGEGGMAVVYMAEQQEPIRRKVALKIIKLGMDTRQVIARFEAERQALAMMDHPNIAKVLDAGATETGRPYFVMELVTGVSITEYCDKNNLSTKDRLALFMQVCNAVQHAHTKGIIHRDIKPSNVMVTHHDGKPVPKVIDFGIAKATNQRLTEKTLFTRYAHIIGTPVYMSPEQAELSDLDIDTRTDIYSLGVLLYELLTGTTPFSEEELRKAGYLEMQKVIREQEPIKPSTKLSTLGDTLTDVAKHRNCTPDLLRKTIRGDLDWIVMKSLEKDRLRRYDAAEALARDIQRHLEQRPVLAHAPSTSYRLHKFLRRQRLRVVGGLVLALLLSTLAIVLSMWNNGRLRLTAAEANRDRNTLSQARMQAGYLQYREALDILQSILGSKHVGVEARLLSDQILHDVRENLNDCTRRIEADPQDAHAYSQRARYYGYLHERGNANADMKRWSAIQRQQAFWNSRFGAAWDLKHVIDGPSDYQLVFSAERQVDKAPELSIAFGQKGRWQMRVFEIPTWVTFVLGLYLLAGPDVLPAQADFTFGQPVNLKSVIPVIDGTLECIDCFSSDGLEMYIESIRPGGQGSWDLWVLRRDSVGKEWGPPENLGFPVNTAQVESTASISSDGLALYFNSNRSGGCGSSDLYMTTRATKNAPWGPPVNLGPKINSSESDAFPWISGDGLELYFSSLRDGGYGSGDIYVAKRATPNDPWGDPVNLGPVVNSPYAEGAPSLSPDDLLLLFPDQYVNATVHRPGGYGNCDMWMSRRASLSAPWQAPVNLGPMVNGPDLDGAPRLSPDGQTLYFATTADNWQAPIIPVVDFNGDGKVDANDQAILTAHLCQNYPLCDIAPFAWGNGVVDANDLAVLSEYIGKDWGDPTLVAHWALDETGGAFALDETMAHHAMVAGSPVWQPTGGKIGGALAFDGTDDYLWTTSTVLDPSMGPFSAIAWVKGGAPGRVILSQLAATDWLYLNQDGMLTTGLKSSGMEGQPLTSAAYVLDGQWHRVAVVWDGMNRALHMDGVEVAREPQSNMAGSTGVLRIGAGKVPKTDTYWFGLIDEVRIYNRAVHP